MKRVLLVDDEPSILVALRSLVERRGWEALVARSGIEALALLDGTGGRPDAVVTDFSMPGMDGLELLAAIRRRDRHLPVILLTAHGSERLASGARQAGACAFLAKPFDIDELSQALEGALREAPARG